MTLATREPMRQCGKRYATEGEALNSKRGRSGNYLAVSCEIGCGATHLRPKPAPATGTRKPASDTGPDAKTRALVLARDGYRCVRCSRPAGPGAGPYSLQHRVARGVGGNSLPQNLIVLCGTATTLCHGTVEARRGARDLAAGWRLESWQDPAAEGVLYVSEHGSGVLMYLDDEGGISPDCPAGAA